MVIERPLVASQLLPLLRAAYGLMLQDRRRYFRLVVELPVSIRTRSGVEFKCKTINISSEGMALRTVDVNLHIAKVSDGQNTSFLCLGHVSDYERLQI